MEYQPGKEPVQLAGDEHDRVRSALRDIDATMHTMAEVVLDTVYGKERKRSARLKQARVIFDNSKFIVGDGENCGVYEEPPGICRECTPQEVEDVSHAGGT